MGLYIRVQPSGKARDFDSLIRWFESNHPCQGFEQSRHYSPQSFWVKKTGSSQELCELKATVDSLTTKNLANSSTLLYGAIVQLGEHLICIQKVMSSILISSTNPFLLRDETNLLFMQIDTTSNIIKYITGFIYGLIFFVSRISLLKCLFGVMVA